VTNTGLLPFFIFSLFCFSYVFVLVHCFLLFRGEIHRIFRKEQHLTDKVPITIPDRDVETFY
jgi:hypothetical protein